MKTILFSVFVLLTYSATAQDTIITRHGGYIKAQIKEVGKQNIIYKHFDHPAGRDYLISKRDVDKIKYQNGSELAFAPDTTYEKRINTIYRGNVLAVAPVQLVENGIGATVSYERVLDKNGMEALYLPLMVIFSLDNYDNVVRVGSRPLFYFNPRIKFYPTSNKGVIKYSIGPSFVFAYNSYKVSADPFLGNPVSIRETYFMFGAMIDNTLNINLSHRLYLGLELGLGWGIYSRENDLNPGPTGIRQLALKAGYRF